MPPSRLAPTSSEQARRRQLAAGFAVLVAMVLVFLLLRPGSGPDQDPPAVAQTTTSTTEPSTSTSSSSPTPGRTTRTLPEYTSTGRYTRMPGKSRIRGTKGRLVTYRVEVERGSGVTARRLAGAVDQTLKHPRGWTANGKHRFQRVDTEQPTLTIRLATPKTVDTKCAAHGANTKGYLSCRAGNSIYLNLDRWYIGVSHIRDVSLYRRYLINHEIGHGLGRGHEACPGEGRRAPVMLQQTIDLDGCKANAWPFTTEGKEIQGSASP